VLLCIRYRLDRGTNCLLISKRTRARSPVHDPGRLAGKLIVLPADRNFQRPTGAAFALIDFRTLAEYEQCTTYWTIAGHDLERWRRHRDDRSGCILVGMLTSRAPGSGSYY